MPPLMQCGHAANAKDAQTSAPTCAICIGLRQGADTPAVLQPDLTARKAHCCYGLHAIVPSSLDLAFFEHCPTELYDEYYCGCYGWE